ncbi:cytochrome P450 [Streptomyces niger]|uniref:cytochrome P450 n=1 Tax=Streptomyces niger TaxID=66373 RepID=UPI000B19479C|nr:cytochrome P450 [Streptomyces niger]
MTTTSPGRSAATTLTVPAFLRGETVDAHLLPFAGRGQDAGFLAPDPFTVLGRLPLGDPDRMRDLYALTTEDVIDCLAALGPRLALSENALLQEALAHAADWSDLTPDVLRGCYERLPEFFAADAVREIAERAVGTAALDGWAQVRTTDGWRASVRAMGSRAVHIIAGNSPEIAALTIIRNAVTRGDAIIKSPSNDPLTALAIARTLAETAPDHPLTRHLAVAYWKGGDERIERALYRPENVEKIVAWGGFASVRHVTRYIQPGLELLSLDPKLSATVIGPEAFASPDAMARTARLAAVDVGALNQLGCFNARVIYAVTGRDEAGLRRAGEWAELLHQEVQRLPGHLSSRAKRFDPDLRAGLLALRAAPDWYRVIGGRADEGAVIVSRTGDPVAFHTSLSGRVANVVPVDAPEDAVRAMTSATQTVGVYPDSLKERLRDLVPLHGVQRLVSLGHATRFRPELPQDAMEPLRRMVKWIVDETYDEPAHGAPSACPVARLTAAFDHHDPEFTPEVARQVHQALREQGRVARTEAYGGAWVLSRYADVLRALTEDSTFSSGSGIFFPRAEGTPRFAPLEYDPPEHTFFRALMRPAFVRAQVTRLAPRVREVVSGLVAPLVSRGGGDLVRELCTPLPLVVLGLAVGFTEEAQRRLRDLTRNMWARMPKDGSAAGFWPQMEELLQEEIRRARERDGGDFLARLVRAERAGRPLTDAELRVMLVGFAVGGHQTTLNALAHLLWTLARDRELQLRLRHRPELMPAAAEEALRLWTPADHSTRVTTREVEIGGVTIPAGDRVILLTGAANRDPAVFPAPEEFRLDRPPNLHLTFGRGIHFCVGAPLARLEFRLVLEELARHAPYALTADPTRFYENGRHLALDGLEVRFGS